MMVIWASVTAQGADTRVYTDKSGRSITAELIAVNGGMVTLKRVDGQSFTVSRDTFSEKDLQFFKAFEEAAREAEKNRKGPAEAPPNSVVIEALVDGPSELRVKKDGIYWINGGNAKPGHHFGQEEPTYVDGKSWRPNWKEPRKDRGVDRTATKSVDGLDPLKTEFKLLNVTLHQGGHGIEKRDAIRVSQIDEELSILIPDSQGGSCWYRFALIKKK
ncbi:SLA1 Homology Domain 1 (SHD1) protein [Prosthecobacter fusiformis]|uniref:SLA1 Homology Domain 1 (SHD1) protein n=1 Tax=Prosthecobacter fusiformis TaxID=48464 RepID=A0A4R7RYC4_9BACT|nr:SHD1 domain-containing protein [Prosthecobacter fusiformis]TDU70862.1 SLA1 Homology Domain 1 (SHD1) protein [Prosthecobacter fusiformis]